MDALVELPGVGRKTANVVLGHALGVPGLPVDRHVLRVANRIGIAESDDPEVVEQQLCAALPKARWTRTSDTLILHGRRICRPKPLCDQCAVQDDCDYYRDRASRASGRAEAAAESKPGGTRKQFERLVADALGVHPAPLSRRDAEHRDRRRGRAVAGAARRDGDRAARHAARPLSGHAAHRAALGLRQHAARSHPDLSGPARARSRRRRRSGRRDRRNADSRDRPLLRAERRRDRGDRGEVLARRRATDDDEHGAS